MLDPLLVTPPDATSCAVSVTGGASVTRAGVWADLAAVGPLLWRHRDSEPTPVLARRHCCEARARIGSDGVREWLRFDCGAAAWLLPDSDYLAWDLLLARLAARRPSRPEPGGCAALLRRRLSERGRWRFGVFVGTVGADGTRFVRPAAVSATAQRLIARIVDEQQGCRGDQAARVTGIRR